MGIDEDVRGMSRASGEALATPTPFGGEFPKDVTVEVDARGLTLTAGERSLTVLPTRVLVTSVGALKITAPGLQRAITLDFGKSEATSGAWVPPRAHNRNGRAGCPACLAR